MNHVQSCLNWRLILILSLVSSALSSASAQDDGPMPANYVLQPIELPSSNPESSSLLKWTNLTGTNQAEKEPHPDTNTSGTLTISSPGYMASNSLYSVFGDFGVTVETDNKGNPIRNVVIQAASMYNDQAGSLTNQLNYNHTLYFDENDVGTPGTGDPNNPGDLTYGYSPELAALAELVDNYQGGPVLTWYDSLGNFGHLTATISAIISTVSDIEIPGAPFQGTYYSFAWQWDLTAIEDVVSISATIPIMRHASTLGLQFDLSDTYLQVVPEPAIVALLLGFALWFGIFRKRHFHLRESN